MEIKRAIVTGAAGFSGAVLTEELRKRNIEVFAVVRPGSGHNVRLDKNDSGLTICELEPERYIELPELAGHGFDVMFHLMWIGERSVEEQMKNIRVSFRCLDAANQCGCRRFVCTGSQAEYGVVPPDKIITEDTPTNPFTAYGAAKAAAFSLTKIRAEETGIDWIWARIFSLIGKYEPEGRMLPDLYHALMNKEKKKLSSCTQNWDYLDVHDAADALIALAEKGINGECYNIARGDFKPLKEYVEELENITGVHGFTEYGEDADPYISLQPSVEKIRKDTGWLAKRSFAESISDYK